jgi:hypothetical protein
MYGPVCLFFLTGERGKSAAAFPLKCRRFSRKVAALFSAFCGKDNPFGRKSPKKEALFRHLSRLCYPEVAKDFLPLRRLIRDQ